MNERLLLKGRLLDAKSRLKEMRLRADNFIILLRDIIDPYEEDFLKLNLERAQVTLADFIALQNDAQKLNEQIKRLENEIG